MLPHTQVAPAGEHSSPESAVQLKLILAVLQSCSPIPAAAKSSFLSTLFLMFAKISQP